MRKSQKVMMICVLGAGSFLVGCAALEDIGKWPGQAASTIGSMIGSATDPEALAAANDQIRALENAAGVPEGTVPPWMTPIMAALGGAALGGGGGYVRGKKVGAG